MVRDVDLAVLLDPPPTFDELLRLHANPPESETEFVVRARARYRDWKPFLDRQWRALGERLEERRGPAT